MHINNIVVAVLNKFAEKAIKLLKFSKTDEYIFEYWKNIIQCMLN